MQRPKRGRGGQQLHRPPASRGRARDTDAGPPSTLADVRALSGGGTIESLRAKAYNVSLECWLEMLPDDAYADFDGRWSLEIGQMKRQAGQEGDTRFYYTGLAQAALLDRLAPGWKEQVLEEGAWLEDLLALPGRGGLSA